MYAAVCNFRFTHSKIALKVYFEYNLVIFKRFYIKNEGNDDYFLFGAILDFFS